MKSRQSWLVKKFRFFFQFKLTRVGNMAVFLMFLSAVGIITTEIPIYVIFCCIIALFGVAELSAAMFRPRLRISGNLPEKVTAGDTAIGLLTVENRGLTPAYDIACGCFILPGKIEHIDADSAIRVIPRKAKTTLPVRLKFPKRGEYVLSELYVHSTFPLNIMRTGSTRVPAQKVTVLPAFQILEELHVPISHRYQHGGVLLDSHSGNAAEYVGNRDYIPGEPTKRLDFRAWARVGKPIVREYQDEFCSRVGLLLDTHEPWQFRYPWEPPGINLEGAISLTASVADALDRLGTTIEMFVAGPDLHFFQDTDPSTTQLESILDTLASLKPNHRNPFEKLNPAVGEALESISVLVCIFIDWDQEREELVDRILQSGCGVRVLLVRNSPPTSPFPREDSYSQLTPSDVLGGGICSL